ncbi:hypothetical protein [Nocardia sp. NPDC127526]|uniref:hypothetical protein n=1 Tax=Nocardia sp. NPDC127526 TaxID=3345393 RepID=UPI00362F97EC
MTERANHNPAMMRWLPCPRPVQVDPRAVLVLPRDWPPPNRRALGVLAGGVDLGLDKEWIPATLHRWLRVRLGFWLGELEIELVSPNNQLRVPIRQWVHQHAIREPHP